MRHRPLLQLIEANPALAKISIRLSIAVIALLLILISVFPPPATAGTSSDLEEVVKWLNAHVLPLNLTKDGPIAEPDQLKQIIGKAEVVSLGEATHGTHEFFEAKHHMVDFLATNMGFSVFSIEANMPEAYRLNQFVLNGVGDPKTLIQGMHFWTWRTKEMMEMVLWMRDLNRSGKGHLQFTGFDMQSTDASLEVVATFMEKADHEFFLSKVQAASAAMRGLAQGDGDPALVSSLWDAILTHLQNSQTVYEKSHSHDEIEWVIQNCRLIIQNARVHAHTATRDECMAENIRWIRDQNKGAKIIIWAHNTHVAVGGFPFKTMGSYLRQWFGNKLVVFGFDFGTGAFRARSQTKIGHPLMTFSVGAPPFDSLEEVFVKIDHPDFILDLRSRPPTGAVAQWLNDSHKFREIGAAYDDSPGIRYELGDHSLVSANILQCFDALLFFRQTESSVELGEN